MLNPLTDLSHRFSHTFPSEKIFSGKNLGLNLGLIYRRGLRSLWGRLEKLETIEIEAEEKAIIYSCAKILADIAALPRNHTYRRIKPRSEDELKAVKGLHAKISGRRVDELVEPVEFCATFLNWSPLTYQIDLLRDQSRQVAVRWSRQTGKTTTFAAKSHTLLLNKTWFTGFDNITRLEAEHDRIR